MQQLKFINARSAEFIFDLTAPYIFWKIDGLSVSPVTPIRTQAAGQHGYTLQDVLLENRTVRLTGHIHGKYLGIPEMYGLRKQLNSVCNPVLGMGRLTYKNDYGEWQIPAFVSALPYADKIQNIQTLSISFECPSPFWLTTAQSFVSLAFIYGGLKFPLKTPGKLGTMGYRASIDNDSDVDTPVELLMDGGSLNPVILNKTTGEFIKLAKQMEPSDQLYINTDPEKLEVSLITTDEHNQRVKSNAYGYITTDSTLFSLIPGSNELTFTSDDENRAVRIRISFYKRYVGV